MQDAGCLLRHPASRIRYLVLVSRVRLSKITADPKLFGQVKENKQDNHHYERLNNSAPGVVHDKTYSIVCQGYRPQIGCEGEECKIPVYNK